MTPAASSSSSRADGPGARSARGTLVVISSVHWHFTWQRHHEMAAGFASRGFEVIFIEPLPKRWPSTEDLSRLWGRVIGDHELAGGGVQPVPDGVRLEAPRILPDTGPGSRYLNRRLLLPTVARRLGAAIATRPLVVLNYLPIRASLDLQASLCPDLVVYDCVTDWDNDPYMRGDALCEDELLEAAELVLADSPYLYARLRERHPYVRRVPPAVDYELWEAARRGAGPPGQRPLCVYFGSVGQGTDVELLRKVGDRFPLRIIGPLRGGVSADFGRHAECLGMVPRAALPAAVGDADVLLLPYRIDPTTLGVIPAKTFECLATGIPTVATRHPGLEEFSHLFYLCDDWQQVLDTIADISSLDDAQKRDRRLTVARQNTWHERILQVERLVLRCLEDSGEARTERRSPSEAAMSGRFGSLSDDEPG